MSTGSSLPLKELQRKCEAARLNVKGSRSTLVKRLQEEQTRAADPPDGGEELDVEAILATETEAGDEGEMKGAAKDALGEALEVEELSVEDVGGRLYVGNRRGLRYAGLPERTRVLEDEIAALKDEVVTLKDEAVALKAEVGSQGERISGLATSLDAYKLLRNRFIGTCKRDKLGTATEADRKFIAKGNAWAHGGDAVVDAMLYQG